MLLKKLLGNCLLLYCLERILEWHAMRSSSFYMHHSWLSSINSAFHLLISSLDSFPSFDWNLIPQKFHSFKRVKARFAEYFRVRYARGTCVDFDTSEKSSEVQIVLFLRGNVKQQHDRRSSQLDIRRNFRTIHWKLKINKKIRTNDEKTIKRKFENHEMIIFERRWSAKKTKLCFHFLSKKAKNPRVTHFWSPFFWNETKKTKKKCWKWKQYEMLQVCHNSRNTIDGQSQMIYNYYS